MRLLLVRHGVTPYNVAGRFQGGTDVPLAEPGLDQARAVARVLLREPLAFALSSPLRRALDTALLVAAPHGLAVDIDPRLRECSFGLWEGRSQAEVEAQFPEDFLAWREKATPPTGGESYQAVLERVAGIPEELAHRHQGEVGVIVAHAVVLKMLASDILGLGPIGARQLRVSPGSISEIERSRAGRWLVASLNRNPCREVDP
jgi:broad specificity phosphatase PhoE